MEKSTTPIGEVAGEKTETKPEDSVHKAEGGVPADTGSSKKKMKTVILGVYILLAAFGIGTGYLLSRNGGLTSVISPKTTVTKTDKVVGSSDVKTFKDSADGVIEKGGVDGEGTHKLIREGGPSQTAFLISSVVDLDEYVGKKVRVWGQTMAAQKAAWLMDVGKIELLTE